jgi:hypothetical protein
MTALQLSQKSVLSTPQWQNTAARRPFLAMSDNDDAKVPMDPDALFLLVFRAGVPLLLGAILTYAIAISGAQTTQGQQLAALQGQLGIIGSQNTDYAARISKLELIAEDTRKGQAVNSAHILVLESSRHYK